jgi:hypothetical protein
LDCVASPDQTHVIDPRSPHNVNRTGHICERDFIGAFDEGHLIGALLKNIREACAKHIPVALLLSTPLV